jgi:hypothetical protein
MLQEYLDRLILLSENWDNEIPERILHGGMRDKKYKCRINWF